MGLIFILIFGVFGYGEFGYGEFVYFRYDLFIELNKGVVKIVL